MSVFTSPVFVGFIFLLPLALCLGALISRRLQHNLPSSIFWFYAVLFSYLMVFLITGSSIISPITLWSYVFGPWTIIWLALSILAIFMTLGLNSSLPDLSVGGATAIYTLFFVVGLAVCVSSYLVFPAIYQSIVAFVNNLFLLITQIFYLITGS